ncbi:MAG TPA: protoglobin domain-containing protein, partial [Planctomycetota bacterium]|nr:protoglobin domain-containing protein [Planctomycetota bacterium]
MCPDQGFTFTEEDLARRKEYLEITPEDEARLRDAHPFIQAQAARIIESFYDYLLGHEHTRSMLEAPGLMDRLKKLQLTYFFELTSGRYDLAYCQSRIRVGAAHHRVGLSPEWYVGAYLKYLHIVTDVLSTACGRDRERFFQTLASLTKMIYFDMGLALEVYHHKAEAGLRHQAWDLEAANAELRRLQASRRLLSDLIVHDLQNPLTGIQALLQVLEAKFDAQPRFQDAIREGLRCCQDLSQMILNVLETSRAETSKLDTHIEEVDLAKLVTDAAQAFRLPFDQDGRRLAVETPVSLVVRTDKYLVRRLLENLLRNALRHTPSGTPVTVRLVPVELGGIRLSVIDEGPGIPLEIQPLLFDPLGASKLRKAGVRVDTGLGLASCHAAATAIGARIHVESDGRSGTAMHVLFPSQPPDAR